MTPKLNVTCTTLPGNSETVVVLDSTRGLMGSQASVHATTGSTLTPGSYRNKWAKAIVRVTVKAATQNVTALFDELTGVAGTSSDWETTAAGSNTVTAGTTAEYEFTPKTADWRFRILAGATAPSALVVRVSVVWDA